MYSFNELLFPPKLIGHLRHDRGPAWFELVDHVSQLPQDHPESLAFSLTMIRLNGCLSCETDSYRAMRGCKECSHQSLRRHKASDDELMRIYRMCLAEVNDYLAHYEILQPDKKTFAYRAA